MAVIGSVSKNEKSKYVSISKCKAARKAELAISFLRPGTK